MYVYPQTVLPSGNSLDKDRKTIDSAGVELFTERLPAYEQAAKRITVLPSPQEQKTQKEQNEQDIGDNDRNNHVAERM